MTTVFRARSYGKFVELTSKEQNLLERIKAPILLEAVL